jgi:hypothetical protein
MTDRTYSGPPAKGRCAVSGCRAEATGFYRLDGDIVVIMVGRPRSRDEIPLCTDHTWHLGRDVLSRKPA